MAHTLSVNADYCATEPRVLYRDEDLLILSKPAGMLTTGIDTSSTLAEAAHQLDPKALRLHPTSRLDRQVSGIVTFARTPESNHLVLQARREGKYQRWYLGLCLGELTPEAGDWTWSIGIDPVDPKRRKAVTESDGTARAPKPARTTYRVMAQSPYMAACVLKPQTGRTHQLRVHAATAGVPLMGDALYHASKDVVLSDGRVCWAPRVMLHCARIHVVLRNGRDLTVALGIPEDIQRVWGLTDTRRLSPEHVL